MPGHAWRDLLAGNERFISGVPEHPRQDAERRAAVTDAALAARLDHVGRWIAAAFDRTDGALAPSAAHLADWARASGLPGLTALGVDAAAMAAAAEAAVTSSSMKANPASLSAEALLSVMRAAA